MSIDYGPLSLRASAISALVFPFSFILGLGFPPILFGRSRRASHDHVARSREIGDWRTRDAVPPTALIDWAKADSQ